jgi:D-alanine-D-alanine ligase
VLPDLPDEVKARLQKVALDACRALLVRDYARVDMRLTETGDIYVIEVNANCDLASKSEFAAGARAGGVDYKTLINRIVEEAIQRRKTPRAPVKRARKRARSTAE